MRRATMTCRDCNAGPFTPGGYGRHIGSLEHKVRIGVLIECEEIAAKLADAPEVRALVARIVAGGPQAVELIEAALRVAASRSQEEQITARLRALAGNAHQKEEA